MNIAKRTIRRFSHWLMDVTDRWEPVERVLGEDLNQELLKHPGEWVAMTHDRLVAAGPTPQDVLDTAHAAGEATPILYRVPDAGVSYILAAQA